MFAVEYESIFIDDEPEYDAFQFDDLCSTFGCLLSYVSKSDSTPASLELKLFLILLGIHFWKSMNPYLLLLHLT